MSGEFTDGRATYEVADNTDGSISGAKVLRRKIGESAPLHLKDLDNPALDTDDGTWKALYSFRHEDNLEYDAEEMRAGLEHVLAPGTNFSAKRFICQALPKGYVTLSERRLRRCEGGAIVEEVAVDEEDADSWQKLAGRVLGMPLLSTQLNDQAAVKRPSVPRVAAAGAYSFVASTASGVARSAATPSRILPSNSSGQIGRVFASQDAASAKAKTLGSMDASSCAMGGAGAGGGLGLNKPGFLKVQHFAGAGGRGSSIDIGDDVRVTWLCEYTSDGKGLELKSSGTGGLSEFKAALGESIAWGGFRCNGVDRRGTFECKRPKFIFVQHKPEQMSAMKKAKQGSHKGDVKDAITGAHLDVIVETLADLDEQGLIAKLQAATGAHKPNGYEFEPGVILDADFYGLGIGNDCK
ncbi:unnamed protein product [Polarella glacialis]|uniref:ADF-H domain-containing protein n=1 Tax=Polarella glacialis TaxID=89957 RepID=A0A813I4V6_POLGL|nr:unnamed protein product [Polarella glacialis]